jgi:hypothetical protein
VRVGADLPESGQVKVRDLPQPQALLANGVPLYARVNIKLVTDRPDCLDKLVVELEKRSDNMGKEGKNEVD